MSKFCPLLMLSIILLTTSCKEDPTLIDLKNIEVTGCNNEIITVTANVVVDNPNGFDINLKDMQLQFFYNDVLLGDAVAGENVLLKKNSPVEIWVNSAFKLKELSEISPSIFYADSFKLKTVVKADITTFNVPVTKEIYSYVSAGEIVDRLMSQNDFDRNVSIIGVKSVQPDMKETRLKFDVNFRNTMPVSYTIENVKIGIFNNRSKTTKLGTSEENTKTLVEGNASVNIPFDVKLNNMHTAGALFSKALKLDNSLYLEGAAAVKIGKYKFDIPVRTEFTISPF